MVLVNFTNLDFDQIKTSIKDYLRSNSNFTDYDFEGSSLSQILDVLAYNTYISSYNANMISNEVFIDSATLRENVVSLARNIGYLPRPRTAATTTINFVVDMTTNAKRLSAKTVTLKKGQVASSSQSFGSESYTFCVLDNITVPVVNGFASFFNIPIYEGTYLEQEFTVSPFAPNPPQRYILDNPGIDYNTIQVKVKGNQDDTFQEEFKLANSLFSIDKKSNIFFLQEIPDQKYELIFGDGIFGKKLVDGNVITASYILTNGEAGNRITNFTFNGNLIQDSIDAEVIVEGISLLTANEPSSGGREIEDVQSVRSYSTQNYAAQNRAVNINDFKALVEKVYPEIDAVSVYGGEDLDPPRFGKVFIAVKPKVGTFLSNSERNLLRSKLKPYTVAGIRTEIVDLKFLYIEIFSNVYYNVNSTSKPSDVATAILKNITNYANSSDLTRLKYSKILSLIDNSSPSITSNITSVRMRRDLRAAINKFADYEICFGNEFHIRSMDGYNIRSSGFKILNSADTLYISDIPSDNEKGIIILFKLNPDGTPTIVKSPAGSIDYLKGEVILNPLNITETSIVRGENLVEISAIPESNDIIGLNDLFLQLDTDKTDIIMYEDRILSMSDITGRNYISSSSYLEEDLVRR